MTGKPEVQDTYLNEFRTSRRAARIVLLDGKELRGVVEAFDTFTIRLRCKGDEVLVFKSAIAVIGPSDKEPRAEPEPGDTGQGQQHCPPTREG